MHNLNAAYRDPHGLSWLFPNGVPEDLLSAAKQRQGSLPISDSVSVIERAIRKNRSSVSPPPISSKGRSASKPRTSDHKLEQKRSSPQKTDPVVFNRRENFRNLQFEPCSVGEDTFFVVKGSPAKAKRVPEDCIEVEVQTFQDKPMSTRVILQKRLRVSDAVVRIASLIPGLPENIHLAHKLHVLPDHKVLEELGIVTGDSLEVIVLDLHETAPTLPKLTRLGYTMKPSLADLSLMTAVQLRKVEDFTVLNDHGSIMFEGETDVRGLDIDQVVQILANAVVVYPDDSDIEKPAIGSGLNKAALITLTNCRPKKEGQQQQFEAKLTKYCSTNNFELVQYDAAKGIWQFRVQHF
jgi:hypothetical protein